MSSARESILDYYRKMRNIREFEETIHRENTTGEIPGFLHLYCGEEANGVGEGTGVEFAVGPSLSPSVRRRLVCPLEKSTVPISSPCTTP